jgi:hypothetical protein
MNIVRKFASYNAGPNLTDMMLADYRLHYNLNLGSINQHGLEYKSHYSPWLTEAINTLRVEVGHPPLSDYFSNRAGSAYSNTKETFGIVTFPLELLRSYRMNEYSTANTTNGERISVL